MAGDDRDNNKTWATIPSVSRDAYVFNNILGEWDAEGILGPVPEQPFGSHVEQQTASANGERACNKLGGGAAGCSAKPPIPCMRDLFQPREVVLL